MTAAEQLRGLVTADKYYSGVCYITVEQARALADLLDTFRGTPRKGCCATCHARIAVNKAFGVELESWGQGT